MSTAAKNLVLLPVPVEKQLEAIFKRHDEANRVALVWREPLEQSQLTANISGKPVRLVYCPSELTMREALVNHRGPERLVLLSKFDEVHLAQDVLARLWRNEPQRISPWETLQQLIKVRDSYTGIDPRLRQQGRRWMADALLDSFDRYQHKISFGEVLDQENAWRALALGYFDYDKPELDLRSLFRWSIQKKVSDLVERLPVDVKANMGDWLAQGLPKTARLVERLLLEGHADDLLAAGLACSVMFHKALTGQELVDTQNLYSSRGRFTERFLAGNSFDQSLLLHFGEEAVNAVLEVLAGTDSQELSPLLDKELGKAEQILASLDLTQAIELSDVLPGGFQQKLSRYARQLERAAKSGDIGPAQRTLEVIHQHALASLPAQREQIHRASMALRLARWLNQTGKEAVNSNAIIADYIRQGGFADWARSRIWPGDVHEALSRVYQQLTEQVSAKREQQNLSFARHLASVAKGDQLAVGYIPVEHALDRLVAPIAEHNPVLLLVLDGMSQAVYRELVEDLLKHNWVELGEVAAEQDKCLIAALPTVTQVSRCSLLSGRLAEGNANDEKKAFANHGTLKKIASTKYPPTLFHKQDIQQSSSGPMNSRVRAMIANTEHRVLGAVINAIDDQLSSSPQVMVNWTLESLTLLRQVLEATREAGRVVIATSDHGHVLDFDSFYVQSSSECGERYRLDAGSASDHEVVLGGDRVLAPNVATPSKTVVLPWSERLRYSKTKNRGYHGGGSLQEIVIPVGIFVSSGDADVLDGWREVPRLLPDWWMLGPGGKASESADGHTPVIKPVRKSSKAKKVEVTAEIMDDMFADLNGSGEKKPDQIGVCQWVDGLFTSEVYRQMKARAGRTAIDEGELRSLIELLGQNNGQVMEAAVLRRLAKPKIRLRGFLAGAQKLLNVDGYPILSVDRESQTIKLNINDLKKQFEL